MFRGVCQMYQIIARFAVRVIMMMMRLNDGSSP